MFAVDVAGPPHPSRRRRSPPPPPSLPAAPADNARTHHVIGCQVTQDSTLQHVVVVDVAGTTTACPLLQALAIALVHVAPTSDGALAGPHKASPACLLILAEYPYALDASSSGVLTRRPLSAQPLEVHVVMT